MRWTLTVRGLKFGTKVKGGSLFQRQIASAASTSDSFSGNQDTSVYILLETEDPGATVPGTVKSLVQRGQLHQAEEALERKWRHGGMRWLAFCVTAGWWQSQEEGLSVLDHCLGYPGSLSGESRQGHPVVWMTVWGNGISQKWKLTYGLKHSSVVDAARRKLNPYMPVIGLCWRCAGRPAILWRHCGPAARDTKWQQKLRGLWDHPVPVGEGEDLLSYSSRPCCVSLAALTFSNRYLLLWATC